ncbi:LytTR family DNA-binding domain-containing protein [Clostridium sp. C2-6-12]|uniref:LytR/AlgR family response regulator transcription factor n=1 Tax=Clostridium sp. C2-6-12 TaxID=2698832 RepID=UPI00136AB21D|nr:LytTR family DNA-binding domain-containing protein [Clostridium sp. C2-6-12]
MINVAICDEMEKHRKYLEGLIREYFVTLTYDIHIINFTSGEQLINYYICEKSEIDIIFLDVYLGQDNGIEVAKKIREFDEVVKFVFTTTSTEYALESFCVFPFNYLIKPIDKDRLFKVLKHAILLIDKEKQKSIVIKFDNEMHTIFFKDIKYIESFGKKINIYTKKGILSFNSKLDQVEAKINDKRFLRCHKSFLVNMDYISGIEDYSFRLLDNSEVPIKQREFSNIKESYYSYCYK